MLFTNDLEEIIFNRHEIHDADELVILSGYLGPRPVELLRELPLNTTVIYGMYGSDGINLKLHEALCDTHKTHQNVKIFYSQKGIHSKCYAWRKSESVTHALVGSANFSTNGLTTPNREMLAESTRDTFKPLKRYLDEILATSVVCLEGIPSQSTIKPIKSTKASNTLVGMLSLLGKNGEVQEKAGLNWGQGDGNVTPNDAYIALRIPFLRAHGRIFPPKDILHAYRLPKEPVELIWDDGTRMDGSLEGNNNIDGVMYPKQLTSKIKSEIGLYIRNRINVPSGAPVSRIHLEEYGRSDVKVTLVGQGIYELDFSV